MKLKIKNPVTVLDNIIVIIGILCIFIGIYQIYKPASWIALGIILAFPGLPRKAVK